MKCTKNVLPYVIYKDYFFLSIVGKPPTMSIDTRNAPSTVSVSAAEPSAVGAFCSCLFNVVQT
jgi:hypothetical protein